MIKYILMLLLLFPTLSIGGAILFPTLSFSDTLDEKYEKHLQKARPVTIKRLMDLFDKEWDIHCGGLAVYRKATHVYIDEAGVIYFEHEGQTYIKRGDYTLSLSK